MIMTCFQDDGEVPLPAREQLQRGHRGLRGRGLRLHRPHLHPDLLLRPGHLPQVASVTNVNEWLVTLDL